MEEEKRDKKKKEKATVGTDVEGKQKKMMKGETEVKKGEIALVKTVEGKGENNDNEKQRNRKK